MSETVTLDDPPVDVHLRVNPRARRFTLRLDADGAGARLTLPPGVPLSEARMFLLRQSDWLARALARRPEPVVIGDGSRLPVAGKMARVRCEAGRRRAPHLTDGILLVTGPGPAGPRISAFLKSRARDALVRAAQGYADQIGQRPAGVALRDTVSRWGSCSAARRLSFSWRLAMAPPEVLDYVAAHEVAHLAEMNHGPRFWALVESLIPEHRRHRAWLKDQGRALHRYRFDAT
ncbi:MAG: M48 family metallopeptidase [Paracoccaceae bacterium]|nr:M48 family metallopeptidase [Paracoccaceae bacterium]